MALSKSGCSKTYTLFTEMQKIKVLDHGNYLQAQTITKSIVYGLEYLKQQQGPG